ncbi:MAG: lipoprotein LpqH [Mycobacterium sp.]
MIRGLVVAVGGATILVAGLTGCSSKDSSVGTTTSASAQASASAGSGTATVTIDGNPREMTGQVVCTTAGGNLTIALGQQTTGIAVVMAEDASKVTSVGLGNVDGVVLGFQDMTPGGSASATRDGKRYTISGTASGVDMANPMQPITKPFEIAVTCP